LSAERVIPLDAPAIRAGDDPDRFSKVIHDRRRIGYALALTCTMATAGAYVLAKPAVDLLDPLTFTLGQFAFGTLFVGAYGLVARIPLRARSLADLRFIGVQSLLYSAGILGMWIGLSLSHPTFVALLNRLELILIIVLGIYLYGERFDRREAVGAILAFAGVLLLRVRSAPGPAAAFWWVVAGSISFAAAELAAKRQIGRIHPVAYTYLRGLTMTGVLLATHVLGRLVPEIGATLRLSAEPRPLLPALPYVLGAAFVGPFLGRTLYFSCLQYLEISKVAVVAQSQPVVVALFSLVFLGFAPTAREAGAGALIVLGCLILVATKPARRVGP
jgi:drug/metabolite transporter (DMT)-like permease